MKLWKLAVPLVIVTCFGSVIGFNIFKQMMIAEALAHRKPAVNPVVTYQVTPSTWQPTISAIGFIEPQQGVDITTEVAGKITSINFESGSEVAANTMLISLNDKVEKAQLASTKAKLPSVSNQYQRILALHNKGNASQKELDSARAEYEATRADVERLEAQIAKMHIKTPFAGIVGIRNVNLGEYIQPGVSIVHLEDINNMKLRFTVSQNDYAKIKTGQEVEITVDSYPNEKFKGTISATDSIINKGSGVLEVQATIPNANHKLLSGMYAQVDVILPPLEKQIVVPSTAVSFNLYGETVYLVQDSPEYKDENGKPYKVAKLVNVVVKERKGKESLIASGIKDGDIVVTEGQVRLTNNALVRMDNSQQLDQTHSIPTL